MIITQIFPSVSLRNIFLTLRPRKYIASQPLESGIVGRVPRAKRLLFLSIFFGVNIGLLVAPIFGSVDAGEIFLAFLAVTGIMFWVYYGLLMISGQNTDIITVFRSVVYCTGIYLAAFFSALLLIPNPIRSLTEISSLTTNLISFVLLLLTFFYYCYSIYVSTRIRHGTTRINAVLITVGSIGLSATIPYYGARLFSDLPDALQESINTMTGFQDAGLFIIGEIFVVLVAIFIHQAIIRRHD